MNKRTNHMKIKYLGTAAFEGIPAMFCNCEVCKNAFKLGGKNMSKGVKVILSGDTVHVDMTINMMYGYSIPKVSKQVQEKVSQQIENMTGLVVPEVNVRIAGVNLED